MADDFFQQRERVPEISVITLHIDECYPTSLSGVGCFFILSAEGACFQARATPNYPLPKVLRSIVNRPFDPSSASLGIVGDFLVISIVLFSDADACDIGELG